MSKTITLEDKTFVPYLSQQELEDCIYQTAQNIYADYKDKTPIFVGVLNGAFMFLADLLKAYPGNCEVAFLQMKSYEGTASTGVVKTQMDLTKPVKNRDIILVEDIVDTGNTLMALFNYFKTTQAPKSLKVASLFLKPEVYKQTYKIDYIGREIENKFIVGYGLDYNELGRNLPDLYQVKD